MKKFSEQKKPFSTVEEAIAKMPSILKEKFNPLIHTTMFDLFFIASEKQNEYLLKGILMNDEDLKTLLTFKFQTEKEEYWGHPKILKMQEEMKAQPWSTPIFIDMDEINRLIDGI